MKFQKNLAILFCVTLMISVTACSKNKQTNGSVSSRTQSSSSLIPQVASSSASTSASSKPISSVPAGVSSSTKKHASKSTSCVKNVTSKTSSKKSKSLVFAEDDNTKAIFHIGMTRKQVKKALKDNHLRIKPNDYGTSDEEVLNNDLGFDIIGGADISFDSKTDLLNQLIIWSASDTELSSPYETQKGLKIGDPVKTVIKLYGEPLEKSKGGDAVNGGLFISYYYDLPINLDNYYKECKEIVGPDNSSGSKKRGAHFRIDVSQIKGYKFNRVDSIVYYADNYGNYLR